MVTDTVIQRKTNKHTRNILLEGQTHLPAIFMFLFNMILSNDVWEIRLENIFRCAWKYISRFVMCACHGKHQENFVLILLFIRISN